MKPRLYRLKRPLKRHILKMCAFVILAVFVIFNKASAAISPNDRAVEQAVLGDNKAISPNDEAVEQAVLGDNKAISPNDEAVEDNISADDIAVEPAISADDKAIESNLPTSKPKKTKTPPSKIIQYAESFWNDANEQIEKRKINISGTKTFDLKQSQVQGSISHFSTNNYDCIPGFKLNQSLHLEIDGNITDSSVVHAVLDDTEDEDRRFTVNIDGPVWQLVMGDFQLALDDTKLSLFKKEVRGVMASGAVGKKFESIFLFSQSKGAACREQFRGAGQQQEFTLKANPIVENSETVYIDGVALSRGTDYFIDYEDGVLKLQPRVLPVEATRWVVVEYEAANDNLAFKRNILGTRQVYRPNEHNHIGLTWLREIDSSSPKSQAAAETASGTLTPMQHDIYESDIKWQITPTITAEGEAAVSVLDPNKKSNLSEADKSVTGHASRFTLSGTHKKADAELSYRRIDKNFKAIGRSEGVVSLGEREALVNDILSGIGRFNYKFNQKLKLFSTAEKSETNISDDPKLSAIDFKEFTGGLIFEAADKHRLEVRAGRQRDSELGPSVNTDIAKNTGAAVYDKYFGRLKTQTKAEKIEYDNAIFAASSTESLELGFNMGAKTDDTFSWSSAVSCVTNEDSLVTNGDHSRILNYELNLNYDPNRAVSARTLFQWRKENDNYKNTQFNSEVADTQLRYEPNRDLRTEVKYKIENTSTILRDDTLDDVDYIAPESFHKDEPKILEQYDAPVKKTTLSLLTDYQINRYLQTCFDWRRRDVIEQIKDETISTTDRKTCELRYTPADKLLISTEYEEGITKNKQTPSELFDDIKSAQIRYEFARGYILDTTYEEKSEDDKIQDENDTYTITKIAGLERVFNPHATLELNLQHDAINSSNPSTEFKKELAVVLTPSSRNQRYRFYANHKNVEAKVSGREYELGLSFSQFIGTDTIIDGEIKKLNSSKTPDGDGYDATVVNAKMVITF